MALRSGNGEWRGVGQAIAGFLYKPCRRIYFSSYTFLVKNLKISFKRQKLISNVITFKNLIKEHLGGSVG